MTSLISGVLSTGLCTPAGLPNEIYIVPATGIPLRHKYAKHAFYDTWTQIYRWLFYNPQSFDAPPQGTLANIPNVPYISRN